MKFSKRRVTQTLFIAVSILGIFSSVLLLSDPPQVNSDEIPAATSSSLFSLNSTVLNRSLASVTGALGPSSDILLNLNCAEVSQSLETSSPRFRLRGDNCVGGADKSSVINTQIKNTSNGYVATVFHRTPQTFTTDYINLNEGKNEIQVRFESQGQAVEKTVTITRQPATAKN